jgi:outer membrane receptor protein involved in Fe transport
MKITTVFIHLFILVSFTTNVFAQQIITGRIIDNQTKEVLIGASVVLSDTNEGATTDLNGRFSFETSQNVDSLSISYIGYQNKKVKYSEGLNIFLTPLATQLEQIIVSASREEQERKNAPVAISTISSQVIEEAKATSIEQVINKVSGVYMVDLGNEQHSMSVRQPLSYKSLFLYLEDGIPIRTTGVFNHNALIEINMASVRNMEVIKGSSSSLYGSEAIGGAVNFITHRPTAVPVTKVQLQGNNLGYKRTDIRLSNSWKKFGVVVSGYYANRSNGPRDHTDFNKLAINLRGDLHISDKTIWTNSLSYINYKTDMTGSLDSANFYNQNFSSLNTFTYREVKALRFRSTLEQYWNDNSKTTITAFMRDNSIGQNPHYRIKDDYQPWSGAGDPLLAHSEINVNSFQSYGLVAQHSQKFDFMNANLIVGSSVDYSPNEYNSKYIRVEKNNDGLYTGYTESDSLLTDYKAGLLNTALYTQLEFSPMERLKVVAAVRYDRIAYDYDNALDSTAFSGTPDEKNSFQNVSPKLGFTYDLGKGTAVYANYSIGFSPPGVSELYRGVKVPSLSPATYSNYEVGFWLPFAQGKGYIDLSLYQLDGTDEIISVRQDDGSTENENAGKTKHKGIEFTLKYSPIEDVSFRFSGANSEHSFVDFVEKGRDYTGNLMNAAPKFIANSEITYRPRFLKGARIALEWQHMSEYYLDAANTEKYEGFELFNLRMGYKIKAFDVWLNTLNLADKRYATNASKSAWGKSYRAGNPRTFNVGISYNFTGNKK